MVDDGFSRAGFQRMLGDALFLRLKPDTKKPAGSFSEGRRNRLKNIPRDGNYGIIPRERLVILDIDIHRPGTSVEEQLTVFSKILETNLEESLTVSTPSGGLHVYLLLPESVDHSVEDLPKMTLRSLQTQINEYTGDATKIDADIRSMATNAYVVGPSSRIKGSSYTVKNLSKILSISENGFNNLISLERKNKELKKKSSSEKSRKYSMEDFEILESTGQIRDTPSQRILDRISKTLNASRADDSYHRKRAFVKTVLSCCYSNDSIARACILLDIDRDSFTGSKISRYSLQKDIHFFLPAGKETHSNYCLVGRSDVHNVSEEVFDATTEKIIARREKRRNTPPENLKFFANPRVLDFSKASKKLLEGSNRVKPSKQYCNAMILLEELFNPLMCAGAGKVLLARVPVSKKLGLTNSQLAQAVRILRVNRVIELVNPPRKGVAPTYRVTNEYVNPILTKILRKTWAANGARETIVYNPREYGFVSSRGVFVYSNDFTEKISKQFTKTLEEASFDPVEADFLTPYLRSEFENFLN